ncbi:MAG: VWA domain-containing protein [Planctomycetota bacterium]
MGLTETWPLWGLLVLLPMAAGLWATLTDRSRGKRWASFGLRALAVVLLVLALCRPTAPQRVDRLHAVFVVDVSASVDLDSARAAVGAIEAAIEALEPGDTHAVLAVGAGLRSFASPAALDETLTRWAGGAGDDRFRAATDLSAALRAAQLTIPDAAAAQVVLFTDRRSTGEGAAAGVAALERQGAEVWVRPLAGLSVPEVAVTGLAASPAFAHEGEVVRLTAEVVGNRDTAAELRIVHRGVVVARRGVTLRADERQTVAVNVPMLTPGRTLWTAEIAPVAVPGPGGSGAAPADRGTPAQAGADSGASARSSEISEGSGGSGSSRVSGGAGVSGETAGGLPDYFVVNNAVSTTVHVSGRPRVLVLHGDPRAMRGFATAMEKQDLVVEVRPAEGVPGSLEELLVFDAVVLADVAATELRPAQLGMLKRYVADFGGGLAMLGSENSFGLGGYYGTAVEDVLPLSSRFEQEKEKPSMAMVLVIDKSGSMGGLPIALARQAAKAAVDLLGPQDQVGVVGFDGQAFVAAPLQSASDRAGIKSAIDRLGAGGGTFMYAGMDAARQMLDTASARIKHMIVLGDGVSQAADHAGLAQQLVDSGVTISTVALGGGADQALMSMIAEIGRGRYYLTMDPASVPQIFTRETMQASRSAIKEDLFAAVRVGDHPLLSGYENTELPFTLGYVMTRARPTAQVLLNTDTGDPLLAVNPFGLGQGMAFTGDLTAKWGGEWLAWSGFGKFWSQAMRALVRRPNTDMLEVQTSATDRSLRIEVVEPGVAGEATASGAGVTPWRAEVLDGAGRAEAIEVRPVGVGRYVAEVGLGKSERLTVRLHDPVRNRVRVVQHDRPYPAEYRLAAEPDPGLAAQQVFEAEAIRSALPEVRKAVSLTPWLVLLAIGCFTGGVLLRRV